MSLPLLKVMLVNVHRSNNRIHALLQRNDDVHILLIQEPWFGSIATLRSNTNPLSKTQLEVPANSIWDLHMPRHSPTDTCKVIAYTCKSIASMIRNDTSHPMVTLNTLILDVLDNTSITLHLINVYHARLERGHDLHHIIGHDPDNTIPTALVGDFNTHSPLWSLPNHTPSSWATALTDWMGVQGFQYKNLPGVPTWVGSQDSDHPSVLDLVLANNLACYSAQLGDVIVSVANSLESDHATLIFDIYPLDSIALIPPPRSVRV
jgi:Endonuclease-reverse transcriptase